MEQAEKKKRRGPRPLDQRSAAQIVSWMDKQLDTFERVIPIIQKNRDMVAPRTFIEIQEKMGRISNAFRNGADPAENTAAPGSDIPPDLDSDIQGDRAEG